MASPLRQIVTGTGTFALQNVKEADHLVESRDVNKLSGELMNETNMRKQSTEAFQIGRSVVIAASLQLLAGCFLGFQKLKLSNHRRISDSLFMDMSANSQSIGP